MERRTFLRALAAMGGLAAVQGRALARTPLHGLLGPGAARASHLTPPGQFLIVSDLHNHTLISGDAAGDPYGALAQMRAAGIDAACLTEHAISGKDHGELTCPGHQQGGCHTVEGINASDWAVMAQIADASYVPGEFVSFRGFEYSTPTVGHLNVYYTREFTDALHEHAFFTPAAAAEVDRVAPVPSEIVDNFEQAPDIATMRFFYEWLASDPDRAIFGGGNDGIACFNHPNEFGDFEGWVFHPGAAQRLVSFEALNADRDFFFHDRAKGMANPFNACLNAGWRVGFTGVSDEHGTTFGRAGLARGGLWVTETSRTGVRAALEARRSFATLIHGLRLDATLGGYPMGAAFAFDAGTLTVELDLDAGPSLAGTPVVVEVIRPSSDEQPSLVHTEPATLGTPVSFDVAVDRSAGDWMFLRICDPVRAPHAEAVEPFASHGGAVAYASPWFFDPA